MSVNFLLLSHGFMCKEIKHSAEMIIGDLDKVFYVPLEANCDLDIYRKKVSEIVTNESADFLILVDLFGGTPFITANLIKEQNKQKRIEILTGLNLPMMIEAATNADATTIEKAKEIAYAFGISGIRNDF